MGTGGEGGLEPDGVVVVRLLTSAVRPGADDVALADQPGNVLTTSNGIGKREDGGLAASLGRQREHQGAGESRVVLDVEVAHVAACEQHEDRLAATLLEQRPAVVEDPLIETGPLAADVVRGDGAVPWPELGYLVLDVLQNPREFHGRGDVSGLLGPVFGLDPYHQRVVPVIGLGPVDDPRIDEVRILRPQEIPGYVADGLFDVGIAGRDWIEETRSDVVSLGQLKYSKATAKPVKIVLAVPADSAYESISDLPQGVRVASEYPELTNHHFSAAGIEADVRLSYGATEAKAPDIVDAVVDLTETGSALKAAGLKIIDEILTSYTEIFANGEAYADAEKRKAMEQIKTLLDGVLDARGRVLMKLNVGTTDLDQVISVLPSMKAPTVNELWGGGGFAVETVVNKGDINILIPQLLDLGATDVIELPISKIVP